MKIFSFATIAVFQGNWRGIYDELFKVTKESGLYDATERFYYVFVGGDETESVADSKIEVLDRNTDRNYGELPTLKHLWDFSKSAEEDIYVYYWHLKGLCSSTPIHRGYLAEGVLFRWRENISLLDGGVEVTGLDWYDSPPHFPGNFWWARTSYLRSLSNPHDITVPQGGSNSLRHKAEFWVGSGKPLIGCLKKCWAHWYNVEKTPEKYRWEIAQKRVSG